MRRLNKSGFTLVELLVVTVVVVSLMAVMFRLSGIAGGSNARQETVRKLQCLENCLSGYYAAFGSYPPVPLQGASRNVYRDVSSSHKNMQSDDDNDFVETLDFDGRWHSGSVRAACLAQPVAALFPPPTHSDNKKYSDLFESLQNAVRTLSDSDVFSNDDKAKADSFASMTLRSLDNPGFLNRYQDETDFRRLPLFRYGLMSFLLPRYRFMLECAKGSRSGNTEAFNNSIDRYRQWTEANPLPPRMDTGIAYESWKSFCDIMGSEDEWMIDLIPSQAACARWMPNLQGIVSGAAFTFFGIQVGSGSGIPEAQDLSIIYSMIYGEGGSSASGNSGYPLLSVTVRDGWNQDFYYYSPAPYQSYVLWSSGEDKKTFPPWVDMESFKEEHPEDYDGAVKCMADDIKFMSTGK